MKTRVSKNELRQAVDLYRKFREAEPEKLNSVEIVVPKIVMVIGYAEYVGYSTTHKKKSTLYEHKFAEGSRPLLCSSADGKQLLLVGGRYNFTADGIVDFDANGKSLYPKEHGRFREFSGRDENPIVNKADSLTDLQEKIVAYLHRSKQPNAVRTQRAVSKAIRLYCEPRGYTDAQISNCIRDTFDVYRLERDAE